MKKKIELEHLKPGMFLIGMDQSWWNTPFLLHHRFIKNEAEIEKIRKSGVKFVFIDTAKGKGLTEDLSDAGESDVNSPSSRSSEETTSESQGPSTQDCQVEDVSHSEEGAPSHWDVEKPQAPQSEHPKISAEEAAQQVRGAAVQAVEQVFEGVFSGEALDNPRLEQTTRDIVQNVVEDHQALPQLVLVQNLSSVDKHLYSHVVDVCALAVLVGIEMGWDEPTLQSLAMGSLLHDIGYVRLPNNLVRNRKHATGTELQLLAKHSEIGQAVAQASADLAPDIQQIIREHHERLDGSGPQGLGGEQLSPLGQVVGLVDQFDKLTSNWGMGPSRSSALVLRDLYQGGKDGVFPIRPIERLIQCLGVYPLGSFVELATGERGIVVVTNPSSLLKPTIKVIAGEDHLPYPVPFLIDLANPSSGDPDRSIRTILDADQEHIKVEKYMTANV